MAYVKMMNAFCASDSGFATLPMQRRHQNPVRESRRILLHAHFVRKNKEIPTIFFFNIYILVLRPCLQNNKT